MKRKPFIDRDRLQEIRANTDWMRLVDELGIRPDQKKSRGTDWWGYSPFSPGEQNSSFHIDLRENGQWYCHSTGQGGGPIELVQRLEQLDCYAAGRWLLEHGVSTIRGRIHRTAAAGAGDASAGVEKDGSASGRPATSDQRSEKKRNEPIRVDLRYALSPTHPEFDRRGIPPRVLEDLGAGYLKESKWPLKNRLVFQVRGLREKDGELRPVILTHMGRALTPKQETENGKWFIFSKHDRPFHKTLELYNLDLVVLDPEAVEQAQKTGHVLIVEGCFDVAKLYAAGIRNVVASFGGRLFKDQLPRLELIREELGVSRFLMFYDRDKAGEGGADQALDLLRTSGFEGTPFPWDHRFPTPNRGDVSIDPKITDPCEFNVHQLDWLREKEFL